MNTRMIIPSLGLAAVLLFPACAQTKEASVDQWYGYPVYPEGWVPDVPVKMSSSQWLQRLTPAQFAILRSEKTEPACSGEFWNEKRTGAYYSAATGQPLFHSGEKFDSGTGWPSFFQPVSKEAVILRWDLSYGMKRIEVLDSSSASHLGHVFDDAWGGTGLRFCINSGALIFVPDGEELPELVKQYQKL